MKHQVTAQRLKDALAKNNMKAVELADRSGVSKASVSQYVNGSHKPSNVSAELMAEVLGVAPLWLMGFDVPQNPKAPITHAVQAVRIPVYGVIPAGVPMEAIEDIEDWEDIPADWTRGDQEYFALRIRGDSMEPTYHSGDVIIVRRQPVCESGQDCVVFVNGDDATFKRVVLRPDCAILQPLNPEYEPMIFERDEGECHVTIAGVCVELRRKIK